MAHALPRRRTIAVLTAATLAVASLPGTSATLAAPGHNTVVSAAVSNKTPDIINGTVFAIHDAGSKVIVGGSFTIAQNRNSNVDIPRNYVLAFDKATGAVDPAFAPVIDGDITALQAGPTAGTVYLAGKFNTVNGTTRRKVALVNVSDGSLVTSFAPPAFNGLASDIVRAGSRLFVTGIFTTAGTQPRGGLASLNASTGALDGYLTTTLTENHNWNGSGAKAGVGGEKLALSPDGTQLVVIGNFKKADGVLNDQVVKLDLGESAATIADWNTSRYTPACARHAFDSYMRDVAYSPDGSYFVIVTTGGGYAGTLCDTAARFEADATGTGIQPTWINYSGGDTLLSVGISEQAIYIGGHIRWVNNTLGKDNAKAGAVGRASIAALDPVTGLPLAWNPGRNPRGYGVAEMLVTPEGIWLGSDTQWIGSYQHRRERIAFFPLTGGNAPHSTATLGLPGHVYQAGVDPATNVLHRVNAGGDAIATGDSGPDWSADSSAAPSTSHNTGSETAGYAMVGSVDTTVPASTPAAVFNSERYDPSAEPTMQWEFPVPAGTQVEVRLYLASRSESTATTGARVFDVTVDGAVMLDDFDAVAAAGHNVGTMRKTTIVSDGTVDIDFGPVTENPSVSAIEIVKTGSVPAGTGDKISARSYDGQTSVGASITVANPDSTAWSTAKGAFWVGGTLFYGMNGALQRRSYDGNTFGPPSLVDPYHDPYWDNVTTGSGPADQTYAGVTVNFYPEIANLTGMFYTAGRLYYTINGQSGLFWRWFHPEIGVVGADKFTVSGATGFTNVGGLFVSGGKLYMVQSNTGNLVTRNWVNGAPSGTATVVSGPAVDGVDWRGKAVFIGPEPPIPADPAQRTTQRRPGPADQPGPPPRDR